MLRRCTFGCTRLARHSLAPQSWILLRRRCYADRPQSSPTRFEPESSSTPENVQNEFAQHTVSAFKDMRKVVLFLAYGSLIAGVVSGAIFEAAHFWIESKMREGVDDDAQRWGWEKENWSDGETGGTSPALGFWRRHSVRAAWFSLHYGKYFNTTTTISQLGGEHAGEGSLNLVDASLESARVYLEQAMPPAGDEQGHLDGVALELLERHAAVLERLGTMQSLVKARDEYLQVFHGRAEHRLLQARLAVKLGDLSERLGNDKEAVSWWTLGMGLTKDGTSTSSITGSSSVDSVPPVSQSSYAASPIVSQETTSKTYNLPSQPPSSPAAQRTLAAAMLSLSAYYSKRKQLHEAHNIQEHAIRLIDSMVPYPKSFSPANRVANSPGQILHYMYLLHRKSLLWLHHGEVTFAIESSKAQARNLPHTRALMDLLTAAASSEVVAQILTGQPLLYPDVPSSHFGPETDLGSAPPSQGVPHPPSPNSPLLSIFLDSPALTTPGKSVLRNARLTTAEAWDLCGVLHSDLGGADNDAKALDCFERALAWVGDSVKSGSHGEIGEKQWEALWARFVAAREKVLKKPG